MKRTNNVCFEQVHTRGEAGTAGDRCRKVARDWAAARGRPFVVFSGGFEKFSRTALEQLIGVIRYLEHEQSVHALAYSNDSVSLCHVQSLEIRRVFRRLIGVLLPL